MSILLSISMELYEASKIAEVNWRKEDVTWSTGSLGSFQLPFFHALLPFIQSFISFSTILFHYPFPRRPFLR